MADANRTEYAEHLQAAFDYAAKIDPTNLMKVVITIEPMEEVEL